MLIRELIQQTPESKLQELDSVFMKSTQKTKRTGQCFLEIYFFNQILV